MKPPPGRFVVLGRLSGLSTEVWLPYSRTFRTPRAAQRRIRVLGWFRRVSWLRAPWIELRVVAVDGVQPGQALDAP